MRRGSGIPGLIRWLVALVGARVLSIRLRRGGGQGHAFAGGIGSCLRGKSDAWRAKRIRDPRVLKSMKQPWLKSGVVVDPAKRREVLAGQLKQLARSVKGRVYQANL